MADVLTKEQRRKNMQSIKSKNTKIEQLLRKALWERGYRYRKNYKRAPGTPDIAFVGYKIAIFCDSEYFHGKDWPVLKKRIEAGNNPEFWTKKIARNIEHDKEINRKLMDEGWVVLRFWGEDIKKNTKQCIDCVEAEIKKKRVFEKASKINGSK